MLKERIVQISIKSPDKWSVGLLPMHRIREVHFLPSLNGLKIFLSKIHLNNLLTKPEDTQLIYSYIFKPRQDEDTLIKVQFTLSKTSLSVVCHTWSLLYLMTRSLCVYIMYLESSSFLSEWCSPTNPAVSIPVDTKYWNTTLNHNQSYREKSVHEKLLMHSKWQTEFFEVHKEMQCIIQH